MRSKFRLAVPFSIVPPNIEHRNGLTTGDLNQVAQKPGRIDAKASTTEFVTMTKTVQVIQTESDER